jgi:hypothetical protein
LIDSGLVSASGVPVDIAALDNLELSARLSQYRNGRVQTFESEMVSPESCGSLNALFGSESTETSREKILSSALIYGSIIIDDPLVVAGQSMSLHSVREGLKIFSDYFQLIQSGLLKIVPLSFYNRPSDEVPLLQSDDAFRSAIPANLHDYIHQRAQLRSVHRTEKGEVLLLREDASLKRRPALAVCFSDDYWCKGVQLYLFRTIEEFDADANGVEFAPTWNSDKYLDEDTFQRWSYQTINQAMRVRLRNIYNETSLAQKMGHTYITESSFEAELLALSGAEKYSTPDLSCRFFQANQALISISSAEMVVELRTKFPRAFERFNSSLLYAADRLRDVDPQEFDAKAKLYFSNEILPQIEEFRANARSIGTAAAKGIIISIGGISTAILSGSSMPLIPSLLLAAAGAVPEVLEPVSRHRDYKKRPAYIWHRIAKK